MIIKWTEEALIDWQNIADYIVLQFGIKAFNDFDLATDKYEQQILSQPSSGAIQPTTVNSQIQFRYVMVNRLSKMIYHSVGETIFIDAFWDTRLSPLKLSDRLLSK